MLMVYPSLVAAPLLTLGEVLQKLDPFCDGYHIDIMDNHFVPNLTWGSDMVNVILGATKRPIQVHAMIEHPEQFIKRINLRHGDEYIPHYEALASEEVFEQLLADSRARGYRFGLALNPKTPVSEIEQYLPVLDTVLVMSVHPGFSGQKYLEGNYEKVLHLQEYKVEQNAEFTIGIDGGVDAGRLMQLSSSVISYVAAATAVFGGTDYVASYKQLKEIIS